MDAVVAIQGIWVLRSEAKAGQSAASLDDAALMLRYRKGDAEAFEVLYRRHSASLNRFIRRLARSDADEIFQEVWIAVIRGRERYEPTARFTTYLYAIAHRRIADHGRRVMRENLQTQEQLPDLPDLAPGPLVAMENSELGKALHGAIQQLPPQQRETFLLQSEAELSLAEIAEVTCVGRETVKSRLRYANRALRNALERWR